MSEFEPRRPGENHFDEKASTFLSELRKAGGISHVAFVKGEDETKHPFIDVYTLPKQPINLKDKQQGEQLEAVIDAFSDFSYSVRPDVHVYLRPVNPAKCSPERLEKELEEECKEEETEFLGLFPVSSTTD